MAKLESGKVKSETKTEYKGEDKDGKKITEVVTKDNDTGEVNRKVDGKEIKLPESKEISYSGSNFEQLQIIQTNKIINMLAVIGQELAAIRYYSSFNEPEEERTKRLEQEKIVKENTKNG